MATGGADKLRAEYKYWISIFGLLLVMSCDSRNFKSFLYIVSTIICFLTE